mmetsp:Transcript_16515/g.46964  ORF Transcript_16515/g.46964 Transcript_16515/m.46964 type:complete len:213 (-) Transcript_16515:568-1206(-)
MPHESPRTLTFRRWGNTIGFFFSTSFFLSSGTTGILSAILFPPTASEVAFLLMGGGASSLRGACHWPRRSIVWTVGAVASSTWRSDAVGPRSTTNVWHIDNRPVHLAAMLGFGLRLSWTIGCMAGCSVRERKWVLTRRMDSIEGMKPRKQPMPMRRSSLIQRTSGTFSKSEYSTCSSLPTLAILPSIMATLLAICTRKTSIRRSASVSWSCG